MIAILLLATTRPLEKKRGEYARGMGTQGPTRPARLVRKQTLELEVQHGLDTGHLEHGVQQHAAPMPANGSGATRTDEAALEEAGAE